MAKTNSIKTAKDATEAKHDLAGELHHAQALLLILREQIEALDPLQDNPKADAALYLLDDAALHLNNAVGLATA